MNKKPHILLNALHSHSGGGLVYLQNILPHLAQCKDINLILLCHQTTQQQLEIPDNVHLKTVSFGHNIIKTHLFEQLVLPILARVWHTNTTLCNASYVPLLAPNPVPIVHVTPSAQHSWKKLKMKIYWTLFNTLTHLSLWRAKHIAAVSRTVIQEYCPKHLKKTYVAPPAVKHSSLSTQKREPYTLLAVGDFYQQKDYPLLIEAFALIHQHQPQARLNILGHPVFPSVMKHVEQRIQQHNLNDAITIQTNANHTDVLTAMDSVTLLICTSSAESFGMPILEAMSRKLPVITTEFQHMVEDIAGTSIVHVPRKNGGNLPAAYATAAIGLLENPSLAQTLANKAYTQSQNFTWAHTTQQLLAACTIKTEVK